MSSNYQQKRKLAFAEKVKSFLKINKLELYQDPQLKNPALVYSARSEAYHKCPGCDVVLRKLISNLLSGRILCKICGGKKSNTESARNKYKSSMLQKYGVDHPQKSSQIRQKTKATIQKKYGKAIKEIRKSGTLQKYGVDTVFKLPEIQDKIKNTNLEKFGVTNINQLPENRNSLRDNMVKRFGHGSPLRARLLVNNNCKNYDEFCSKVVSKLEDNNLCANHPEIEKFFKSYGGTLIQALIHAKREDLIRRNSKFSIPEKEIVDLVKTHYSGEVIENDRKILKGKELDIYLPELKIAIEYNGLIWHSERFDYDKNRHYKKYKNCLDQGIKLYTFWSHEWFIKRDQLTKFIINLITSKTTVYARKCKIETDPNKLKEFIENNHLQGSSPSHTYLGLTYNNNVVMALSIGDHPRKGSEVQVLNRVCFSDYHVVGGLNKLLKLLDYELITWSDNRYSPTGNMYKNAGFEVEEELKPDYFYCDSSGNVYSKQSQKKSLTGCPKEITEANWSIQRGLYRIWDCGKKRWIKKGKL
jgi:hypothetical protein